MGIFVLLVAMATITDPISARQPASVNIWQSSGNESSLLDRSSSLNHSRILSRKKRFFAPLPEGAAFILTPKFTMPIPGLAPGGSELHVEVPLSFNLPTIAEAAGARANGIDGGMDTYSYYRRLEDDRLGMYSYAENFISRFGLDGKQCVLRTICEVAEAPVENAGVMGEIVNTLLRNTIEPEQTTGEGNEKYRDYVKAEKRGKLVGHCDRYYSSCPVSVFKLV